jgi:hypothetical protein
MVKDVQGDKKLVFLSCRQVLNLIWHFEVKSTNQCFFNAVKGDEQNKHQREHCKAFK